MRFAFLLALTLAAGCPSRPAPPESRVHVVRVPIAVAVEHRVVVPSSSPSPSPPSPVPELSNDVLTIDHVFFPVPDLGPTRPADYEMRSLARGDEPDLHELVGVILANRIDTNNPQGRVVEACSLARRGHHFHARLVLEKVAAAKDCAACVDALTAIADASCEFDAETKKLAKRRPSAVRTAAISVLAALESGRSKKFAQYIEGPVTFTIECSVCDEGHPPHVSTMEADAFKIHARKPDRLAEEGTSYHAPALLFCDDKCCSGPTGPLSHSATSITSICFTDAASPKLSSISALAG